MDFTGERYVPTERGEIRQEHLHRYAWAQALVRGKDVLDVASGRVPVHDRARGPARQLFVAFSALRGATDFESAVKRAIMRGGDTAATAAIVGGLAGLMFEIPDRFLASLGAHPMVSWVLPRVRPPKIQFAKFPPV